MWMEQYVTWYMRLYEPENRVWILMHSWRGFKEEQKKFKQLNRSLKEIERFYWIVERQLKFVNEFERSMKVVIPQIDRNYR